MPIAYRYGKTHGELIWALRIFSRIYVYLSRRDNAWRRYPFFSLGACEKTHCRTIPPKTTFCPPHPGASLIYLDETLPPYYRLPIRSARRIHPTSVRGFPNFSCTSTGPLKGDDLLLMPNKTLGRTSRSSYSLNRLHHLKWNLGVWNHCWTSHIACASAWHKSWSWLQKNLYWLGTYSNPGPWWMSRLSYDLTLVLILQFLDAWNSNKKVMLGNHQGVEDVAWEESVAFFTAPTKAKSVGR